MMKMEDFTEWCRSKFSVRQESGLLTVERGQQSLTVEYVDLSDSSALARFASRRHGVRDRMVIYSDEWEKRTTQWKSAISAHFGLFETRIGARTCALGEVSHEDGRRFLDENHIQGKNSLSLVYFGLSHEGEMVGLISLGRHNRHTVNNLVLLDRLCFKNGVQVVGGASRLVSRCMEWAKEREYDEIISFSDNRWSDGGVYTSLGMALDVNWPPDYCYIKNGKRLTKQSQKKSACGCPDGMTEYEWATARGMVRIYDLGKKRWTLNLWPDEHETRSELKARRCAERQRDGEFNNSHIRGHFSSEKNKASIYYASSYELRCMFLLEQDQAVRSFRRCDAFKAEQRWRNPDLLVEYVGGRVEIVEVKAETTLMMPEIAKQIEDSVAYARDNGLGFRLWTEKDSQLSGQTEIISWAKKYIAQSTGDTSVLERSREAARLKVKRYRQRLAADRVQPWCTHCNERHDIPRVTFDKSVEKHGRYVCKSEACTMSGKTPKTALRNINPHTAEGKKKCTHCGEVKLLNQFKPKQAMFDHLTSDCRDCINARRRKPTPVAEQ